MIPPPPEWTPQAIQNWLRDAGAEASSLHRGEVKPEHVTAALANALSQLPNTSFITHRNKHTLLPAFRAGWRMHEGTIGYREKRQRYPYIDWSTN